MEEDYQKALELIFSYDYGCCMFNHNICGDQLGVSNDMLDSFDPLSPEFFVNPKCPPVPSAIEAIVAEVDHSEAIEEPKRNAPAGGGGGGGGGSYLIFFFLSFFF